MGQVLLVTLREGIEMFLIVAIAAAYLRKTGRAALLSASLCVWVGCDARRRSPSSTWSGTPSAFRRSGSGFA